MRLLVEHVCGVGERDEVVAPALRATAGGGEGPVVKAQSRAHDVRARLLHHTSRITRPGQYCRGMTVVRINAIDVLEGNGEELERRFAARVGAVEGSPGFRGFQLLRPTAGEDRYFVVTHWDDEESFAAWRDGSGRAAHAGEQARPVSGGASLLEFDVVLDVRPTS